MIEVGRLGISKRTVGSSSQPSDDAKRPKPKGPMGCILHALTKVAVQRQKQKQTIDNVYNKAAAEIFHTRIARRMYDAGIPFNVVKYNSFDPMIEVIGQCGSKLKPSSYQVRVSC